MGSTSARAPFLSLLTIVSLACVAAPVSAASSSTAPGAAAAGAPAAPAPATSGGNAGHVMDRADLEAFIDGFMPLALQTGDIAGGVIAVVKDGEILFAKGYGYADVAARKPVDPATTMFRPGSVSKLFTWTAVMQLVGEGKLDLDKDVATYLDFRLPQRADGPITLRNIMTHTAGFEEQVKDLIATDPKSLLPLRDYVANFIPTRIYRAGSTPAYSNYATALAGYIVQRVSGEKFADYIDEHILRPLDMQHSTFQQPLPQQFAADMSRGYQVASGPAQAYELVNAAPAGSLAASGEDMARFMIAHLQDGEYHGRRILPQAMAQMMHDTPTNMIAPLNRMMLGFYEQNYNGHRVISHGGDTEYMHSYLHLFPDDHVGLFVSFNSAGREGGSHVARQALFDYFVARYFPGPQPAASTVTPQVAAQHARLIAGYYDDSRRPDRSFLRILALIAPDRVQVDKDGLLTFSLIHDRNTQLRKYREVAPFVWRDVNSNWRLAAQVVDGKVARLSVDEVSPFMVFEPFPWSLSPAWQRPAAIVALAACLLTALLWPIAVLVRRRLRVPAALPPRAARARRYGRIAATALALMSAAWTGLVVAGITSLNVFSSGLDPVLWLMYLLSVIVYVGGTALMLWSTYATWTAERPWTARLWSLLLALSALLLLQVAWSHHLMSFMTRY
ncbi:MAG: beta-lactamase family protein [Proteobacteria bacterium]|nr:beta-lactamase family protein [Pseudomonadota bacterium]